MQTPAEEPAKEAEPLAKTLEQSSPAASTAEEAQTGSGALAPASSVVETTAITLTQSSVDLLKFVRFTDFVPCDYNQDGIVDILALNSRLSTGYGFSGVGNGLFTEGPSFDLPFRPAAAVPLGTSGEKSNGLFLVSSVGTVSIFYPLVDKDPSLKTRASKFTVFRIDSENGPIFAVYGKDKGSVHLYFLENGSLQDKGERPATRTNDIATWYEKVTSWKLADDKVPVPLPPLGMEKIARLGDLNGDKIPDLVYYNSGKIVYKLSQEGKALAEEKTISCQMQPASLRIADVDGNGLPDVLALISPSGTLEVYLTKAK